ncbi:MAG: ATP-binding protein [Planctomycetota bacterium]|nr:MAG: ATP-binding protein [Planctomycetota bacterium]
MSDTSRIELNITSNARSLPVVRSAVERMARLEGFGDADAHALVLAIDEALANVIEHGYGGAADQPIGIVLASVRSTDGRLGIEVSVRDQGRQVDPDSIVGRDLGEVRPGGLGVHIIRSVMDEVEYRQGEGGGMLLRMVKYVGSGGSTTDRPTTLSGS